MSILIPTEPKQCKSGTGQLFPSFKGLLAKFFVNKFSLKVKLVSSCLFNFSLATHLCRPSRPLTVASSAPACPMTGANEDRHLDDLPWPRGPRPDFAAWPAVLHCLGTSHFPRDTALRRHSQLCPCPRPSPWERPPLPSYSSFFQALQLLQLVSPLGSRISIKK